MKCEAYKDKLFLYEQLDKAEKHLVDRHISTCPNCAQLLKDARNLHSDVLSSVTTIEPLDANRLTNRIMEAVAKEQSQPSRTFNWWPSLSGWNLIRLSLSSLSIVLILSFGVEFTKKTQLRPGTKITPGKPVTILNSSHFFGKFRSDQSEKVGFLEAQQQYRRSKLEEKPSYWSKLKEHYESEK